MSGDSELHYVVHCTYTCILLGTYTWLGKICFAHSKHNSKWNNKEDYYHNIYGYSFKCRAVATLCYSPGSDQYNG